MLLTFITISQLVPGGDDIFNRQSFDALFGNKEKVAKNLVNIEMFLVKQMHFDYAELLEIDFKEKIDLILNV